MRALLFLTLVVPVCGAQTIEVESLFQPAPLSGNWKHQAGDDARWADPAFHDAAWQTVAMPGGAVRPGDGFSWFRFRVRLPENMPKEPLALMLGGFSNSQAYEVFWNGQRLGTVGVPDGGAASLYLPVPGLFPVPAAGREAVVAIRLRTATLPWAYQLDPAHRASWLGTRQTIDVLGEAWRGERLRMAQPQLLIAASMVIPGLFLFLIQLWRRDSMEYFWFGLWLLSATTLRVLQVYPEAFGLEISLAASWGVALGMVGAIVFLVGMLGVLFQGQYSARVWVAVSTTIALLFGQVLYATAGGSLPVLFSDFAATAIALALCFVYYELAWRTGRVADSLSAIHGAIIAYLASLVFTYAGALVWRNELFHVGGVFVRTAFLLLFSFALAILMNQRSARLLGERQRLGRELESAAEVQSLLMTSLPAAGGPYRIEPVYVPASEVGGDFYQVLERENGSLLVLVGDVSGKGLKAAMLVSAAVGILRRESSSSPGEILANLNDALAGHMGGGFTTCCCACFAADGTVTLANAGHPSPYCDGREMEVQAGLPLGVMAGVSYEESVARGDRFTFVSDGVVEAENAQRELFGFDRTLDISGKSAQEIAEAAKAWGQNDDITVVTVRRNA